MYDHVPWQSESLHVPLPLKALGFWTWWLFIIPSLRARKPSKAEKSALNWAFLASPLVSIALPVVTRDTVIIWWANFAATAGCYIWAIYFKSDTDYQREENVDSDTTEVEGDQSVLGKPMQQPNFFPKFVLQAFKALDYGSGQERGTRK